MAVHLPRPGHRHRQSAGHPGRNSGQLRLTSATVMNSFFVPQLGSQIYTMGGMATHLNLLADEPGEYPGFSANFSGDGFSEMRFIAEAVPPGDFERLGRAGTRHRIRARRGRLRRTGQAEQGRAADHLRSVEPKLFERIIEQTLSGPARIRRRPGVRRASGRRLNMLGKLSWAAIPWNEPLPLFSGRSSASSFWPCSWVVTVKGWWPISVARVAHQRRPQAHRRDVHRARPGHAAARLSDAIMMRSQQAIAFGERRDTCRPSTTTRSSRRTARS